MKHGDVEKNINILYNLYAAEFIWFGIDDVELRGNVFGDAYANI